LLQATTFLLAAVQAPSAAMCFEPAKEGFGHTVRLPELHFLWDVETLDSVVVVVAAAVAVAVAVVCVKGVAGPVGHESVSG